MMRLRYLVILLLVTLGGLRAQNRHILKSEHIPAEDTIWVFTPSGYDTDPSETYPLIYLLHGWNGSYHQWNDITDCQSLADQYGFIIVCPDGLIDSWYFNSPAIRKSQYADFFFLDLVPFISENYHIDNNNIYISGLSMGGHGALYLFAQKPELFKSAGSLSGVLDLRSSWHKYRIYEYLGINKDQPDQDVLNAYSVVGNIGSIDASGKEIIFTCGRSDRFLKVNNRFKRLCDKYDIPATYIVTPGDHDYAYWKSAIGLHFDFFSKQVK